MISNIDIPFIPGELTVLHFINGHHTPFLDAFMYMISNSFAWIPFFLCLVGYLFYKKDWREGLWLIVILIFCITLSDQLSSHLCKPFFARYRPSHYQGISQSIHSVYNYVGGSYGFYSSHASNVVAVVTVLSLVIRDKWSVLGLSILGLLVLYSRMYLGVHFLSDIIVGALVGLLIGFGSYWIYSLIRVNFIAITNERSSQVFGVGIVFLRCSIVLFLLILSLYALQVNQIIASIH